MAVPGPNSDSRHLISRIFFITGFVFLFLMAFLWSADGSFRYIGFGIAFFCLFMGIWLNPQISLSNLADTPFEELKDDINTIFTIKKPYRPSTTTQPRRKPTIILIALAFISFVFVVIIVGVVSLSDETGISELYQEAEFYRLQGQYDSAENKYRKVLSRVPQDVNANAGLANVFLALQSYDSALKYFERTLREDPSNDNALYNKALIRFYQKEYQQSLEDAYRTIQLYPEHTDATLLMGNNYYLTDRYDSAMYWYTDAYEAGVRSADLLHVMAYISDTQGKNEDAVEFYREALQYDSSRVEIYQRLGELFPGEEGNEFRALAQRYAQTPEQ
jgi:Tfp pilus assembly protein PilF